MAGVNLLHEDSREKDWKDWIGRRTSFHDTITQAMAERFLAAVPGLNNTPVPADGEAVPPCFHWCLSPVSEPAENLGRDGHPRLGIHVPPVPLERRMWAGGELSFLDNLRIGDHVTRETVIRSVEHKQGRSGELVFVTLEHEFSTRRGVAARERQDLVYRGSPGSGQPQASPSSAMLAATPDSPPLMRFSTDPVLLFRYSAITFNAHRIHYDRDYAISTEGYDGVVVHGPLLATLLAQVARRESGRLSKLNFRGHSPLICGEPAAIHGSHHMAGPGSEMDYTRALHGEDGNHFAIICEKDGRLIMTATAS